MAMNPVVEVFCVLMPCSVMAGYRRFRGQCCLDLHPEEAALAAETLIS